MGFGSRDMDQPLTKVGVSSKRPRNPVEGEVTSGVSWNEDRVPRASPSEEVQVD